ncbi:MAG TPA: SDR family NAD(P)-dependent oxidoreductase [Rubrobacter sp.]|nr:SDR family NAD(P)-dependent oxidoreductase [Rubrobacter sp.]
MGVEPGRIAVVTGSTSGIGAEIARRLGEAGASVAVTGRGEARAREVVHEIVRTGGEAVFFAHELEEAGTTGRLVEETVSALGGGQPSEQRRRAYGRTHPESGRRDLRPRVPAQRQECTLAGRGGALDGQAGLGPHHKHCQRLSVGSGNETVEKVGI